MSSQRNLKQINESMEELEREAKKKLDGIYFLFYFLEDHSWGTMSAFNNQIKEDMITRSLAKVTLFQSDQGPILCVIFNDQINYL